MSTTEILILVVGALGFLAIGSFICVIIDRLPVYSEEPNSYGEHWDTRPWGEVLGGNSRCSSCGTPVRPYDNIPIVSWLRDQAEEALSHAQEAGEMITHLGGHPSLGIGQLLETHQHDIGQILRESLEVERAGLVHYNDRSDVERLLAAVSELR